MRKISFLTFVAASLFFVSCGDDTKKGEVKEETPPNVPTVKTEGLRIAYYYMDSLKSQFTYYKNEEARITKKSQSFENQLMSRQKSLIALNERYQERLQSGSANPTELTNMENEIKRRDKQLQVYNQEEGMRIQEEANASLTALSKKIEVAAEKYSKKYGIDILLTHGPGGQITFITKKMDVTKSFIEFLNKEQSDLEKDMGQ